MLNGYVRFVRSGVEGGRLDLPDVHEIGRSLDRV